MDMRKLLLCAFLLSATTMQAKSFAPNWEHKNNVPLPATTASNVKAKSFHHNIMNWEDRPLTLDDFMGKKLRSDTTVYNLYWIISNRTAKIRIPHGRLHYQQTYLTLDQNESFIDPNYRNENMLRFCQIGFNLMEYYRRKSAYDLVDNPDTDFRTILRYYNKQHEEFMDEVADSTQFGQNQEVLSRYEAEVNQMLAEPELDPTQIPLGKRYFGIDIYVGYNLRYTSNDFYTNAPSGICLGYTFDIRRHLFGIDFNCNFGGKSKEDFSTDRGPIDKGSKVEALHGSFMYGYLVNPNSKHDFYPTLNIGFTSMTGKEFENEKGKKETPALQGFCFGLGCRYDIPLFDVIRLNNGINNIVYTNWSSNWQCSASRTRFAMQLRPQLLFTKMDGGKGLYPSVNLSVTLSWNTMLFGYKTEH